MVEGPVENDSASRVISSRNTLMELNLVRAWWILLITTLFTVLFSISGEITGTSEAFSTVQWVDYIGSTTFLALFAMARWGRLPQLLRRMLTPAYATFFVLINDGYYFSAWPVAGDNVGYAFGVLTPAALLYLRPAFFTPFLVLNHLFVSAGIVAIQPPFESMVSALYGTTITMLIAVISSIIQYRTKIKELEKTALVARRNRELAASNSSLLSISQTMDETMALAAHDLRSPLLSLASLCEMGRGRPGWEGKEQAEFLDMVQDGANRMASLVNRMLADYASRNGSIKGLSLVTCDLVAIFEAAAQQARPSALRKNIQISSQFPEVALAEANPEALERIFGNLISNAIKYSPPGSSVELRIGQREARWICEVEDEGLGIPLADRPALFNKLQRGSNRPTSGEESTGLGLYITRKLAESMQGAIEFEPASKRGSIFRVSLNGPKTEEPAVAVF